MHSQGSKSPPPAPPEGSIPAIKHRNRVTTVGEKCLDGEAVTASEVVVDVRDGGEESAVHFA